MLTTNVVTTTYVVMFSPFRFATEHCDSCGSETHIDALQVYRFEIVCPGCYQEHEAASHSAALREFRGNSLDWLRRSTCDECHLSTAGELSEQHGMRYCRPCTDELAERRQEAEHEAYYGGTCPTLTERYRGAL